MEWFNEHDMVDNLMTNGIKKIQAFSRTLPFYDAEHSETG